MRPSPRRATGAFVLLAALAGPALAQPSDEKGTGYIPSAGHSVPWARRHSFQYARDSIIEREDSDTLGKRRSYGLAELKRNSSPVVSTRLRIVQAGIDGFRVGQLAYLTDGVLTVSGTSGDDAISDYELEIVGVDTECGLGTGTLTYDLSLGDLPLSGIRRLRKHRRR